MTKLPDSETAAIVGHDDVLDQIAQLDAELLGHIAQRVVTRLSDLHGYGEARTWGLRLADDLRAYREGGSWDDVDRGALLSGSPGCGKTFFAKALAAECDVPLIATSYADWETRTGPGNLIAKAIKGVFADARRRAPCILFIDEIDTVGIRGAKSHNSGWLTSVVNTLLAELDGVLPREGVVVIGCTNRPDDVDSALLRPGRLDRHIVMPKPTVDDLRGIIMHHLGAGASEDGLDDAARACRGQSPATIAQLAREARRIARMCHRTVCADDVAVVVAMSRPKRSRADDWQIALHEAAHAVSATVLGLRVKHVDVDTCEALVDGPGTLATRAVIEAHIACSLAGRIANTLHGPGPTSGAVEDLAQATRFATEAIVNLGWGGRLMVLDKQVAALDPAVRREVEGMLSRADAVARELLGEHEAELLRVAQALVAQRYLDGDEVRALVNGAPTP